MNFAGCRTVEGVLVDHVRKNETLVVIGETGSGKTTRKLVSVLCFGSTILQCLLCSASTFKAVISRRLQIQITTWPDYSSIYAPRYWDPSSEDLFRPTHLYAHDSFTCTWFSWCFFLKRCDLIRPLSVVPDPGIVCGEQSFLSSCMQLVFVKLEWWWVLHSLDEWQL